MSGLVRFIYARRDWLKPFIFVRKPVLLDLHDFQIYVRLDDWAVGARIAVKRTHERHVTDTMRPLLKPGMVVLDIGANIGYYTLLAASRGARVISFEPNRENCDLLDMSVKANGFQSVTLHSVAVADKDGLVGFETDDSNGGITSDTRNQVRAVKLDTFLDDPRIDLIKMDIEGAEGLAFSGMRELLKRDHPIIFTEFSPGPLQSRSGIQPEEYLNGLRELGYELRVVRKSGQNRTPQSNSEIMRVFNESRSDHLDLVAYR